MKKYFKLMFLFLLVVPFALLAQTVVPQASTDDVLAALLALLGGVKGAGALGISVLVTQLLIKLFSSSLTDFAGKYKLLIVLTLAPVGSVLGSVASGQGWMSALLNGVVISAAQVLIHQVYVTFIQKPSTPLVQGK